MQHTPTRPMTTPDSDRARRLIEAEYHDASRELAPDVPIPIVVPADGGTVLQAFGDAIQVMLSGEQTNGTLAVGLATVPPGGGPPPHIHGQEDELFLIVDGHFRFLVDAGWTEAFGPGTVVYTPRGVRHTFQNAGDAPGRFWGIATPPGFERFFARCADVFAQTMPPDMARILAISAEHGIEYVPPLAGAPSHTEETPDMHTQDVAASIVVPADGGAVLRAFGDTVQIKLSGEQTNGSLVVFQDTVLPGGGPPPHIHHDEDELFLVIEGRFRFLGDGEWTEAFGPGTVAYMPRGARHTFQNVAETPGRFWGITTSSGFDRFFARCADVFAVPGPPDIGRIVEISAEHGIEYVPALPTAPPAVSP